MGEAHSLYPYCLTATETLTEPLGLQWHIINQDVQLAIKDIDTLSSPLTVCPLLTHLLRRYVAQGLVW